MNRSDLVSAISEQEGLPPTMVDQMLGSFMDVVGRALADGHAINLRTFGKFEPRHRRAVTRKNPLTGEPIDVPAQTSVGFVPSRNLKARLNG